jgi:hypothetical protein
VKPPRGRQRVLHVEQTDHLRNRFVVLGARPEQGGAPDDCAARSSSLVMTERYLISGSGSHRDKINAATPVK